MLKRPSKPATARKLLVAAVGVASVNYVTIACSETTIGNPASPFSNTDAATDGPPATSGNLAAPPPHDAGTDADASDASSDAGDAGDAADDADGS